jgi:hypothetical protein
MISISIWKATCLSSAAKKKTAKKKKKMPIPARNIAIHHSVAVSLCPKT